MNSRQTFTTIVAVTLALMLPQVVRAQDIKQIADLTGSAAGALTVTDGHEEAGTPKTFTYTLELDYTNLYFARGGNSRINLMKVTITRGGTSGVQTIAALRMSDGAVFNLAGQKVDENYKGVVIKDGRKMVQK